MKRITLLTLALCLLPYSVEAQVWETMQDSIYISLDSAGNALSFDVDSSNLYRMVWTNALEGGFVQPHKKYKVIWTDSSVQLIERDCWERWLDTDSVSHCGHDYLRGPIDTLYTAGDFPEATLHRHWCLTCEAKFTTRREIKSEKAK